MMKKWIFKSINSAVVGFNKIACYNDDDDDDDHWELRNINIQVTEMYKVFSTISWIWVIQV